MNGAELITAERKRQVEQERMSTDPAALTEGDESMTGGAK